MENQEMQAAEEAVIDQDSSPESESPENVEAQEAEPAPQEAEPAQEAPEGSTPEWFQKAIDRQTYKYREEERKRQAVEEQLEKLKSQMPQDVAPDIPPIPDQFDDDYEAKLKARDDAIKQRVEWDTRQALKAAVDRREQERQAQEAQEAFAKTEQAYVNRAKELEIDPNELANAGQYVGSYLNPNVGSFILESEQGPLITTYLAKNPAELQAVASMPPMQAAAHIAMNIVPNVTAKPKQTQAPPPPETLGGGGTPPGERGPAGATYE